MSQFYFYPPSGSATGTGGGGGSSTSTIGLTPVQLARNDYTITPVTTAAYVQLIASTSDIAQEIDLFDSSGETLVVAFGGAGSEVDQFYVTPGGGTFPIKIPAGTRVSVKAVTATASVGEINMTLLKDTTGATSLGLTSVELARHDYSSVNVTTLAYTQLVASLSDSVDAIEIYDSSGEVLVLATGGAGSEQDKYYIKPGASGIIPIHIAAGVGVSIKAVSADAVSGEIDLTFMKGA